MTDRDELAAAFDALRAQVLPAIRRPGVAAARQTVRERRTRRRLGGTIGAAVLAVVAFGLPTLQADKPRPDETPVPTPSVSTPAPDLSTSGSPPPVAPVQPGASGGTRTSPSVYCRAGSSLFQIEPRPGYGFRVYRGDNYVTPGCKDDVVHILVAWYTVDTSHQARLAAQDRIRLDTQTTEHTFSSRQLGMCFGYFVVGDRTPVPAVASFTVPSSGGSDASALPYAMQKQNWNIQRCVPPTTTPPPPPPSASPTP